MVVGDDAQCLVEGTLVTMADGTRRPIEQIAGRRRDPLRLRQRRFPGRPGTRTHRSSASEGIAITLRSGRRLVSTPEHAHFAGYQLGRTPQMHMTYLMWRRDRGFRVGTSRTYTNGQVKPVVGVALRILRGERADAAWVISTHGTESDARYAEAMLSLRYGIPTLPFSARSYAEPTGVPWLATKACWTGCSPNMTAGAGGVVSSQIGAAPSNRPHFQSGTFTRTDVRRRRLAISLCGDRRGGTPDASTRPLRLRRARPTEAPRNSGSACARPAAGQMAGGSKQPAGTWRPSSRRLTRSPRRSATWRFALRPAGSNLDGPAANSLPFTPASRSARGWSCSTRRAAMTSSSPWSRSRWTAPSTTSTSRPPTTSSPTGS